MDKIIRIEDFTYAYPGAQQPTLTMSVLRLKKEISSQSLETTAVENRPYVKS